jgi:predicted metalloprotease with PDZ domain
MRSGFAANQTPIRQNFLAAVSAHGLDVSAEVSQLIDAGNDVVLEPDTFAPCGQIVSADLPRFHRGFDIDATTANKMQIAGVDPELPAYQAGLRDGMTLVKRDAGVIGDSTQEIAYRVLDHGTERVIRYLPQGHGTSPVQSLVLKIDESVNALAECRRRLGAAN